MADLALAIIGEVLKHNGPFWELDWGYVHAFHLHVIIQCIYTRYLHSSFHLRIILQYICEYTHKFEYYYPSDADETGMARAF